ncbi:MAG: PEGA domain-containing protein [Desulfocapsaceae bacterium]|nr:PEGA domain-containing protein [Desulfocapsaceae bacterium]
MAGSCNGVLTVTVPQTAGSVLISSTPPGAEIFIDNIDQGVQTPITVLDLPAGVHTYKLTLTGYNITTGTFTIISGQTITVATTLTPTTPATTSNIGTIVAASLLTVGVLGVILYSSQNKNPIPGSRS